jgi:hypothetical protein
VKINSEVSSHIFLHLYHSIVDLCDDFKDQTEYGVIIRRFNDFPTFVQPVIQPVTESGQIKTLTADIHDLKSKVLDLQCRSMKNNLVFTGLYQSQSENCENKLRGFIRQELEIDHYIEFGNIHRFGRRGTNNARPIVARVLFIYNICMHKTIFFTKV